MPSVIGRRRYAGETYPQARARGELAFASSAAMTAYPVAGLSVGTLAFLQSRTTFWSLQAYSGEPDGWHIAASSPSLAWVYHSAGDAPAAQAQPTWLIDPVDGDDDAPGTAASGRPVQTWAELVRRWGTVAPLLRQNTWFQFLRSQPDNSDQVEFRGRVVDPDVIVNLLGTPTVVASGALGAVGAKGPSGALTADLGPAAAQAVGLQLFNATRNAYCWVDRVESGTVCVLSQPFAPSVTPPPAWWQGGAYGQPAEVNAFAEGDAFQILEPTQVYVSAFCPVTVGTWEATGGDGILAMMGNVWVPLTTPSELFVAQNFLWNPSARITQCRVDAYLVTETAASNGVGEQIFNSFLFGGGFVDAGIYGGVMCAVIDGVGGWITFLDGCVLGGDMLVHYTVALNGRGVYRGTCVLSKVCGDAVTGTTFDVNDQCYITGAEYGEPATVYGAYTFSLNSDATVVYDDTATSVFLGTAALTLNGSTTATAIDRSVDPVQMHAGRALSPANLSAPVASGGFGDIAMSNSLRGGFASEAALAASP